FHALYDHDSTDVYTVQLLFDVDGPLDGPLLHTAAQVLLRRHPHLGGAFPQLDSGHPVHVIPNQVRLPWREINLTGLTTVEANAELNRLAADDYAHGFDLSAPPLLRMTLLRLAPTRHRLIMTSHHILFDGWS